MSQKCTESTRIPVSMFSCLCYGYEVRKPAFTVEGFTNHFYFRKKKSFLTIARVVLLWLFSKLWCADDLRFMVQLSMKLTDWPIRRNILISIRIQILEVAGVLSQKLIISFLHVLHWTWKFSTVEGTQGSVFIMCIFHRAGSIQFASSILFYIDILH